MSYYATGTGKITFDLSKVTPEKIQKILSPAKNFGCDVEEVGKKKHEFYLTLPCSNYIEDSWYEFLVSMNGLLKEGEILFDGENHTYWRFQYRNDRWCEDSGFISYTDGPPIEFEWEDDNE